MPIYEYLCSACNERCEKIQARPFDQITCPSCGKKANRLVSITASSASGSGGSCSPPSGSGFG